MDAGLLRAMLRGHECDVRCMSYIFLIARDVDGGGRQKICMAILELFLQFRVFPSAPNQPFDISDRILKRMRR